MDHFRVFENLISVGHTVLDIGGHRGDYGKHFSSLVGENGKVYSFEPHPDLYPQLENIAISCPLANIFPFPYAVSNTIGQETLYSGSDESCDGASTICVDLAVTNRLGMNIQKFNVKTITLDFLCQELGIRPDFVKIDVEGAESRVILGMQKILHRNMPIIFFEFGLPRLEDPIPLHLNILRRLGYALYLVDFTRFLSYPPTWDNILSSSNPFLMDKIFTFTDELLLSQKPFHANILSLPNSHRHQLSTWNQVLPLSEAIHLLTSP